MKKWKTAKKLKKGAFKYYRCRGAKKAHSEHDGRIMKDRCRVGTGWQHAGYLVDSRGVRPPEG
jgi:hypothetical protein